MNIGLGKARRTILLVDPDAHARAILRRALEAAGFSVGEACSNHEGERTALRIRPDAILAELVADTQGDDRMVSERLITKKIEIPCYIVSTASDALMGSIGLDELGIAGVFLKPIEADVIVRTLEARFSVSALTPAGADRHA